MIRLHRAPAPAEFASETHAQQREKLRAWYLSPAPNRPRRSSSTWLAPHLRSEVRAALRRASHGKCAYCESALDTARWDVGMFRPLGGATDLKGVLSRDHYGWLSYEWSNYLAMCAECNKLKGPRFPVAGERAPIAAVGPELAQEEALLIDPFAEDPQEHLVFDESGAVAGRTERGRITVEILGLNRHGLVRARAEAVGRLLSTTPDLSNPEPAAAEALRRMVADDAPFAGACRQILTRAATRGSGATGADLTWLEDGVLHVAELKRSHVTDEEASHHLREHALSLTAQEAYSVAQPDVMEHYYIRTRLIERIEIENFRAIERMELAARFAGGSSAGAQGVLEGGPSAADAPWLMLLGENGVGKSSVLQAVALCLLGQTWRKGFAQRLGLDARRFVRRGAERGEVRVFLTGGNEPIRLTFSTGSSEFHSSNEDAKVLLLGYGSTRLLPRAGTTVAGAQRFDFAQTDNLFNPFVPLGDAEAWLVGLDEPSWEAVAGALGSLLQLRDGERLLRAGEPGSRRVEAEHAGTRVSLEELSDGYQSVLALSCDIMRVMLARWSSMDAAEGIVLLDEIGSHLHPRWRMRVVSTLRRALPRVQFIASTHDPLCLRGLNDGEVVVVRRDAQKRVTTLADDLPPIRGLRVDQLLTSEFFGLSSTIDPDLEELFGEYYGLLALPVRDAAQQERVEELRATLDRYRLLGSNRRERMMLEVIDDFIARDSGGEGEGNRANLKEETKNRLRELWASTVPTPL